MIIACFIIVMKLDVVLVRARTFTRISDLKGAVRLPLIAMKSRRALVMIIMNSLLVVLAQPSLIPANRCSH